MPGLTRRWLLVALASPVLLLARTRRIPTMPEELNPFVDIFNRYTAKLQGHVIDKPLWQRVYETWHERFE